MRTAGSLIAVALTLAACTQTPEQRVAAQQADAVAAEKLGKALAGLTPDKPSSSCMPRFPTSQVQAYGPTIVYTVSRNLKYRTDTAGGCERVGRGDILVTQSPIGQLCQGDIATTIDQTSRTFSGSCSFGPFTRYSKSGS
ncbi:hypothetical protein FHT00_000023 [Sphingomonas insulae]|uniref:Outer membrane lipoprotein n=1 Tax=Sphingomonas insulae TaxID=424800 RepID=A0ABN1HTL9_9SPHN|nr:hypothetical protein [Sphingomonas insulae]NIJ28095.1 hypothetical protein [Sphingomonas insulae]